MSDRFYWRRAHQVRLPDRDSQVHRELVEARVSDLCAKALREALATLTAEQLEEVR